MVQDYIDYPKLIEDAMRFVVKRAMQSFAERGGFGDHHFYISFLTSAHGVLLSDRMKKKYPHEMTIVLQYQFEELKVTEDYFMVKLTFGGIKESVKVPFRAVTSFADPSVEFTLQFTEVYQDEEVFQLDDFLPQKLKKPIPITQDFQNQEKLPTNVIQIDKFVKK